MVNGFLEPVVCRSEPRPLRTSAQRPARLDPLRSPTHEAVSPRLGPLSPTCPQGPHLLLGSSIFSLECLREDENHVLRTERVSPSHPHSYVEALTPNRMVLGDGLLGGD